MKDWIRVLGMIGGIGMPIWNIPLIARIIKRKTSEDISLAWAVGVWACILFMLPSCLASPDLVLKCFGISNAVLFSGVVAVVVAYRRKK